MKSETITIIIISIIITPFLMPFWRSMVADTRKWFIKMVDDSNIKHIMENLNKIIKDFAEIGDEYLIDRDYLLSQIQNKIKGKASWNDICLLIEAEYQVNLNGHKFWTIRDIATVIYEKRKNI